MSDPILRLKASQSPVFLVNSRLGLFTAAPLARGAPSPEVTGPICLVPWPRITRAPEDTLLDYLCRFAVRAVHTCSLEVFLGSQLGGSITSARRPRCTIAFQLSRRICLPASSPTRFNALFRQCAALTPLRHPVAVCTGTGILTRFPSAAPLGCALGPD